MTRPIALICLAVVVGGTAAEDKKGGKPGPGPRLTVAVPLTVEPGRTANLTVRGLNLDGVTEVRARDPKAKGKLAGKPKHERLPKTAAVRRIGDWAVAVELDVAKDVPAGTLAFTVAGPVGESNPVTVAVADGTPRVADKEPNEGFKTAQPVPVPGIVDGVIGRERDVDVFRFEGKAGEKVRLEVQAARLGSPLDAMLTVYDADGRTVAADDDTGGTRDPVLSVILPRAGPYYAAVIDSNDAGGPAFAYRLVIRKE